MAGEVAKMVLCGFVTFEFMKDLFALIQKHCDAGFVKAAVILSAFYFLLTGSVKLLTQVRAVYSTKAKLENAKAELELAQVRKELALLKGDPVDQNSQQITAAPIEAEATETAPPSLAAQWPMLVVMVCLTACGIVIYNSHELPENYAFLLGLALLYPVVIIWGVVWEGYQAAPDSLPSSPEHKA